MGDPFNMFIQTHYVELLCVVPGVMLLVGVASAIGIDPYLRKRQKRSMLVICLLELALMAQNYLDYLLCVGTPNIGLRIVDSIIGYSIRPIILLLFLRVAHPERSYKWEWGLVWANAAIYMTALFSDICFTINAKNHYEGGFLLLSQSCLIISLFLLSELVYQTIRDNNSTTRKYAWFPLFVAFIIVLALFADATFGYISSLCANMRPP